MASVKTRTCSEGCRFASLQTPLLCSHKKPRAWKPPAIHIHVFQTYFLSLLITHCSLLIAQRRLKDAKPVRANSRGFSNPWNNDKKKKWRLQRRERAVRVAVPRLYRRHYYVVTKNRGLESPRLFMLPSSRRFFSHYSLLITQSSLLKSVCQDAKPVRANSRGFLNPWNND